MSYRGCQSSRRTARSSACRRQAAVWPYALPWAGRSMISVKILAKWSAQSVSLMAMRFCWDLGVLGQERTVWPRLDGRHCDLGRVDRDGQRPVAGPCRTRSLRGTSAASRADIEVASSAPVPLGRCASLGANLGMSTSVFRYRIFMSRPSDSRSRRVTHLTCDTLDGPERVQLADLWVCRSS
jgi:hypothetical protein